MVNKMTKVRHVVTQSKTAIAIENELVLVRLKGGSTFSPNRDETYTAEDGPFPVPRHIFEAFGNPHTGVMERILKEEQYVSTEEVEEIEA